jgi:methionine synthase I (cobalamin-dependent)
MSFMQAFSALRERLERGETIVLDGPMGSELVRRGVRWRDHGMRTDPELVLALHEEYIGAGADVIRTNTFQLNRRVYLNVFRSAEHMRHIGAPGLEQRAAELTRRAVESVPGLRAANRWLATGSGTTIRTARNNFFKQVCSGKLTGRGRRA